MQAVTYQGPYEFKVKTVPIPDIQDDSDVIVKVKYSGICGTDLHTYRGHLKSVQKDQILGHEFLGEITSIGEAVSSFKVGDKVVSTFTIQCGTCWYCKHGKSGQCDITNTFGKTGLPGGQAEFVRIPYAENCLIKVDELDESYVLMADIFVTGYYGVKKILNFIKANDPRPLNEISVLQLGLGPVGICALNVLKYFGFKDVTCVDNVPTRLQTATDLGVKAVNFDSDTGSLSEYDYVLEVVGANSALETAFKHVRRDGFISSIGMAHEALPFTGLDCYLKNINMSFGRCHSWSLFAESFEIFKALKGNLASFVDLKIPVSQVEEAYALFDQHKVNKVVIEF